MQQEIKNNLNVTRFRFRVLPIYNSFGFKKSTVICDEVIGKFVNYLISK